MIDSIAVTPKNSAPPGGVFAPTFVPPRYPKTAEGFTGLGHRAHISRSTLLLSKAPQMLSYTSRFARLAERGSYFSTSLALVLPPSPASRKQSSPYPCISLCIYHSFFFLERSSSFLPILYRSPKPLPLSILFMPKRSQCPPNRDRSLFSSVFEKSIAMGS